MPSATDRTEGRNSVTTRRPPGRTVLRTVDSGSPKGEPEGLILVAMPATRALARTTVSVTALAEGRPVAAPVGADPWPVLRLAAAEVLPCRLALDHLDRDQGQLAPVVDLADLDLDLVADVDHLVDVLDPPAAVQLADLRNVQQPVLAGKQRHERAERRRLHHGAKEPLADL